MNGLPDESENRVNEGFIGGAERRAIVIADYDPQWPRRFEREEAKIRRALGPAALAIEHVGSTSVPGLAAKPIVDILLVVEDSSDEDSYLPELQGAGYVLRVREPGFEEHRMVRTPEKDVHVHIFSPGSREGERLLLMRDHLRHDKADRDLYVKHQAGAGEQRLADHAALRGRQDRSNPGNPRKGPHIGSQTSMIRHARDAAARTAVGLWPITARRVSGQNRGPKS